jgi:DNA polymerase V
MEIYSIDEAFLDMGELEYTDLLMLGITIRKTILQHIGIPVTIGIASTKTLAKMANRYAKKKFKDVGVFYAGNQRLINEMLAFTEVEDIWGIGKQYATLLRNNGFKTAMDVVNIPADWIRDKLTVVGLRMWKELTGTPCIDWEYEPKKKKNICTSRSFGHLTNDYSLVREAISNYAAACAMKLRKEEAVCRSVNVFISTNPHKAEHKQYSHSVTIQCETPTNLTREIIGYALKGLEIIFKPKDYFYMKCGVMVLDLVPETLVQLNIFDNTDRTKDKVLAKVMDQVNNEMGRDTIRMAVQRFDSRYRLRAEKLSKKYTTDFKEILKVKI